MSDSYELTTHLTLADIGQREWDACACPEAADGPPRDPFTTYRFLAALEDSFSVGPGTGWAPRYVALRRDQQLVGCAPLYLKGHSQGEYIFDFSWAEAYERAGGAYYPKLQVAVPFTPVTGRRLLIHPDHDQNETRAALLSGLRQIADRSGLSGVHLTFCTRDEAEIAADQGYLYRLTQQFHWLNDGYTTFDDFLARLSSRKRKAIRKERSRAAGFGGEIKVLTGDDIKAAHWDAMWRFYQDTGARKWGSPYLSRAFFEIAHATMRDDILLVLAERDGHYVAGAMNMIGRETLYGRYWGCIEDHPCLHFELCYYQAIDYAIAAKLSRVEAGAQGEHKLARGYLPAATHSAHWFREPSFHDAVQHYLDAERASMSDEIEILTDYGPFRKDFAEEQS